MSVDKIPVKVHRCRFVDYLPAAITALAFPPLPLPSLKANAKVASPLKFPYLAIGRANGNIELAGWSNNNPTGQAPQAWVVSKTLTGPRPSKVDTLAFTLRHPETLSSGDVPTLDGLRLFSTGGGSELLEWDLSRGCVRRTINSNGGTIWSVSANPRSTILALGCEDGSIQLLSVEHDCLSHLRKLGKVKSRLLSIAWAPPVPYSGHPSVEITPDSDSSSDENDHGWSDGWLVTGCADSSIRKWDFATGKITNKLTTDKTRGERTLVWSVCVLCDGTIVSGDSMGIVKFWDSRTCTQLDSFQAHGADVLCLAISPEGNAVYSSGVDQKIVQFTNVGSPSRSRWLQTSSRRMHSHDVRSLTIWPPFTPLPPSHQYKFPVNIAPILVSGGLDMSVVLTPAALPTSTTVSKVINPLSTSVVATFEDSYHRKMGYSTGFPGTGRIKVAKKRGLILSAQDQSINLWQISDRDAHHADPPNPAEDEASLDGWKKVLEMDLNVQSNIVSCDISDNGRWIAVSDWYGVKLFRLTFTSSGDVNVARARDFPEVLRNSLPLGPGSSSGATVLGFTPDSQKLVVCTSESSFIVILHLPRDGTNLLRSLRTFSHHRLQNVSSTNAPPDRDGVTSAGDSDVDMDNLSDEDTVTAKQLTAIPAVTRMVISNDCQWLVTADEMRRVYVYNLDSLQHHCVLPTFPHAIQALSFDPSDHSTLVIGLANNTINIFNVESRTFPEWSIPLCNNLPKRFTHLHDPILGLTFNPTISKDGSRKALFWGFTWMCSIKLDSPAGWGGFSKKRRREHRAIPNGVSKVIKAQTHSSAEDRNTQTQPKNFTVLTHYRPLLFVDFLDCGEMVVVERPLVDLMAAMPPAFYKPKYGSS